MSLEQGLVNHYWLDKDSNDSVGTNNGVDINVEYEDRNAIFNGTSSYIDINGLDILTTDNFTISTWLYNERDSTVSFFGDAGTYDMDDRIWIAIREAIAYVDIGNTNSGRLAATLPDIYNDKVINVVVSKSPTELSLYINGTHIKTQNHNDVCSLSDYRLCEYNGGYLQALISNIRIYSEAKDQAFINELYSEGAYKPITQERVDTTSGAIVATGTDGYAVSKTIISIDDPVDLTPGLVAHYLLNNNADDCHGDYDGTPTDVDFKGDSASFNGSTSEIYINHPVVLSTDTSFTISCWSTIDTMEDARIFYLNDGADSNYSYLTFDNDGYIYVVGNVHNKITSSITVSTGTLYHFTVVFNETNGIELFIDGISRGTATTNIGITNDMRCWVGVDRTNAFELNGDISNLRIYSKAKDQTFIDDLYVEGYYPKPLPLPTTDGLVAHYPLTGTAEDSTGNYDGVENNITYINDGEFGSVADFNGSNSYTVHESTVSTSPVTSISVWVKPDVIGDAIGSYIMDSDNRFIISNGQGDNTDTIAFHASDAWHFSGTEFVVDVWQQLVVVVDNTSLEMYLNSVSIYTGTIEASPIGDNLIIGQNHNHDGAEFDGSLSAFRVYSSALGLQEIKDIYNYEKNFRSIDIDDGLVAYYPLKNNSKDNYYNEYDSSDTSVTYDGSEATITGNISFPAASGFVEAHYVKDDVLLKTSDESVLDALTGCTLKNVRKYNRVLTNEEILIAYPLLPTPPSNFTRTTNAVGKFEFANISESSPIEGEMIVISDIFASEETVSSNGHIIASDSNWSYGFPSRWFDGSYAANGRVSTIGNMFYYTFPSPQCVNGLSIQIESSIERSPKNIKIYGDGNVIADILFTFTITNEIQIVYFNNSINYTEYKIQIIDTPEGDDQLIDIGELKLVNFVPDATDTLITSELIKDGDKLVIVKNDDSIHEIIASGVINDYDLNIDVIPVQTSDTSISGTITSSTLLSGFTRYSVFDRLHDEGNAWWATKNSTTNQWLVYEFATEILLSAYSIDGYVHAMSKYDPKDFKLEGSNDNVNWDLLDNQTDVVFGDAERKDFPISPTKKYKYIKLFIFNNSGSVDWLAVTEWNFTELVGSSYQMDTSSVTQGEVPTKAYRVDEGVEFNDVEAVESGNSYNGIYNSYLDPFKDGNLLELYTFEDNVVDSIGAKTLTVVGTELYRDSFENKGFDFDGNTGLTISEPATVGDASFSVFCQWDSLVDHTGPYEGRNPTGLGYNLVYLSGDMTLNGKSGKALNGTFPIVANQMYHFAVVREGGTVSLYIDGVLDIAGTLDNTDMDLSHDIEFGRTNSSNSYGLSGTIDNCAFYNRALTVDEVNILFNNFYENKLTSDRTFNDVNVNDTEVVTKVQMSATGNKMTQLDFDLMKEP